MPSAQHVAETKMIRPIRYGITTPNPPVSKRKATHDDSRARLADSPTRNNPEQYVAVAQRHGQGIRSLTRRAKCSDMSGRTYRTARLTRCGSSSHRVNRLQQKRSGERPAQLGVATINLIGLRPTRTTRPALTCSAALLSIQLLAPNETDHPRNRKRNPPTLRRPLKTAKQTAPQQYKIPNPTNTIPRLLQLYAEKVKERGRADRKQAASSLPANPGGAHRRTSPTDVHWWTTPPAGPSYRTSSGPC